MKKAKKRGKKKPNHVKQHPDVVSVAVKPVPRGEGPLLM